MCCGTGRLLLDYLAQGIDIDGVDNSPEMLALCRPDAAAVVGISLARGSDRRLDHDIMKGRRPVGITA